MTAVLLGLAGWLAGGVVVGVLLGRVVRNRDTQIPR